MGEGIVTRGGPLGEAEGCTFRVDGGVEASGAQAKKQDEWVVVNKHEETRRWKTLNGGGWRGGKGELRDPRAGSEGSYYNKFVGGLRSGNNSELRATLRMCLSLLLFKWKWKATSCNGCDLYPRPSLLSRSRLRICTAFRVL